LSITLHTRQFESEAATRYARERGILLIPGVEQDIEGCHVLLINFPKAAADRVRTFAELERLKEETARAGDRETLVIAPHPFVPGGVTLKEKFWRHSRVFDAVEVSGFYHPKWNPNRKAIAAAEKLGLPLVGNSDTHTLEQFGKTWTEADCAQDAGSILKAVKSGRCAVKGRALDAGEMGRIGWNVIAKGYMKWINYKRTRNWQPAD
jgi:predicted metal-dependent phosphoesterase TrpH